MKANVVAAKEVPRLHRYVVAALERCNLALQLSCTLTETMQVIG